MLSWQRLLRKLSFQFLYRGEGLNKTAIGDYLGEKNEFNEKVLKSFVELHDFTDLILVQVGVVMGTVAMGTVTNSPFYRHCANSSGPSASLAKPKKSTE